MTFYVYLGQSRRTIGRSVEHEGWKVETLFKGRRQTAFDAEVGGVVRALEIIAGSQPTGASSRDYRIFTDSQAAVYRIQDGVPGQGQRAGRRAVRIAQALAEREVDIWVHWVPGHAGIQGNEMADAAARDEVLRQGKGNRDREGPEEISVAWLRERRARKATREWREEIIARNHGRRAFAIPREGVRSRVLPAIRGSPKERASIFFQLESGHAFIAPFLRNKFGWVETDTCWWCGSARQTREHLFKECITWKKEEGWRKEWGVRRE